jgi:hypothetical protein
MKTAILISGELRTFKHTLSTFPSIDNSDIYVSTWNESHMFDSILGIDIRDTVTKEEIESVFDRSITCIVEPLSCFNSQKYNDRMVHRWVTGMKAIVESGIEYDYVLVIRPDMYFVNNELELKDNVQFAWYKPNEFLQDCVFGGPMNLMKQILSDDLIAHWNSGTKFDDWHKKWTDYVRAIAPEISNFGPKAAFLFYRPNAIGASSVEDIERAHVNWRDSKIVSYVAIHGDRVPVETWGKTMVDDAVNKYLSWYFDQYRPVNKRCVVVYGKLRNWKLSHHCIKALNPDNVKVITWDPQDIGSKTIVDDDMHKYLISVRASNLILEPESEFEKAAGDKAPYNAYRILYFWKRFFEFMDAQDDKYDEYILIRPDSFVWLDNPFEFEEALSTVKTFSMNQVTGGSNMTDHFVVVKREGIDEIRQLFDKAIQQDETCIHRILDSIVVDPESHKSNPLAFAVDVQFVRDNFEYSGEDKYDYELYTKVYQLAKEWWEETHHRTFDGKLNKQRPIRKFYSFAENFPLSNNGIGCSLW